MKNTQINVSLNKKIGEISPLIYGHFAEHIGGVIYDGIWVGKNSDILNVDGYRLDVVEAFRKIKPFWEDFQNFLRQRSERKLLRL